MTSVITIQKIDNYGTIQFYGDSKGIESQYSNTNQNANSVHQNQVKTDKIIQQQPKQNNQNEKKLNEEIKQLNEKILHLNEQKKQMNELIKELRLSNEELQQLLISQQTNEKEERKRQYSEMNETNEIKEMNEMKNLNEIEKMNEMKELINLNEMNEIEENENEEECHCSNELMMAFSQMNQMSPYSHFYQNQIIENENNENIQNDENETNENEIPILSLTPNEISLLKQWTQKKTFSLLFDKSQSEFTRENICGILKGKKDVIILFESIDGDIFGSYHSILPNDLSEWCNDSQHFAFTLRNKYELKEKYNAKENNKYSLMICDFMEDDDESLSSILESGYFYTVTMEEKCSINPSFGSYYNGVSKFGIDVFGKDSTKIELKSIVIIE